MIVNDFISIRSIGDISRAKFFLECFVLRISMPQLTSASGLVAAVNECSAGECEDRRRLEAILEALTDHKVIASLEPLALFWSS